MVSLTEDQRDSLRDSRSSLEKAHASVMASVQVYDFPETYPVFTSLMTRQMAAIDSLLATGEIGCELESLKFDDKAMLASQHLKNLAYSAETAKKLPTEAEQEQRLDVMCMVLHDIKNFGHAPMRAFRIISRLCEQDNPKQPPKETQWQL